MAANKFETFEIEEVDRQSIHEAKYNPRKIDDVNFKRLRANLDSEHGGVGLLEPVIVNKRTGNVLSGHQRLKAMDKLNGSKEYKLTVSYVDLDEKTEKEQNIFMNNPGAQGEFDLDQLQGLLKEDKLDFEKIGSSADEMVDLFGAEMLEETPEALIDLAEQLRSTIEELKRNTAKAKQANEQDFFVVAVFKTGKEASIFVKSLGEDENERYLDGRTLEAKLIKQEA